MNSTRAPPIESRIAPHSHGELPGPPRAPLPGRADFIVLVRSPSASCIAHVPHGSPDSSSSWAQLSTNGQGSSDTGICGPSVIL